MTKRERDKLSDWKLNRFRKEQERLTRNKKYCEVIMRHWTVRKSFEDDSFFSKRKVGLLTAAVRDCSWYVVNRLLFHGMFINAMIECSFDKVENKRNVLIDIAAYLRKNFRLMNKVPNLSEGLIGISKILDLYHWLKYAVRIDDTECMDHFLKQLDGESAIPEAFRKQVRDSFLYEVIKYADGLRLNCLQLLLDHSDDELFLYYITNATNPFKLLLINSEYMGERFEGTITQILEKPMGLKLQSHLIRTALTPVNRKLSYMYMDLKDLNAENQCKEYENILMRIKLLEFEIGEGLWREQKIELVRNKIRMDEWHSFSLLVRHFDDSCVIESLKFPDIQPTTLFYILYRLECERTFEWTWLEFLEDDDHAYRGTNKESFRKSRNS